MEQDYIATMAHRCLNLPPSSSSSDHDKKKLVMQPNNPGGKNDHTREDGHSSYSRMMMMMMEDNNPNNNGKNYYYNCYSPSELWDGNPFERVLPFNSSSHEEQPPTKSHGNGILSATNVEQVVVIDNVGGNVKMSGEAGVTTTTTTSSSGGSMSLNNDDSKGCDFKGLKDECQSEKGQEVSGDNCKKTSSGSCSSKRSRAAEVHNLSEKRRRNRINEKMKALQNLIPNSNKTDKASMLDEAIDYLKKLQLQVQMLSARSGIDISSMRWLSQIPHLQIQQPQQAIPNAFLSRSHTTLSSNEAAGIVATSQANEWQPSMSAQPREDQYNDVGLSDNSISGWPSVRKPNESEWTPASSSSCKIGTHQDCFILPGVEANGTQGLHSALSLRDKKI